MAEEFGRFIGYVVLLALFLAFIKFLIFIFGLKATVALIMASVGLVVGSLFMKGSSKNSKQQ